MRLGSEQGEPGAMDDFVNSVETEHFPLLFPSSAQEI